MRPPACLHTLAAWLCVSLAAESAQAEIILNKKVGDEVVLTPGSVPGTITKILWRHNSDLAMEWDRVEVDGYRQFKERGSLNTSTGDMTITGLTLNDTGVYIPEINEKDNFPAVRLMVFSAVPVPTVLQSCDPDKTSCTLTCDGHTTDANPVKYIWKSDNQVMEGSSKEQRVTKEEYSSIKTFSCELQNEVSQESSKPIPNPFTIDTTPLGGHPKIKTGVIVFITLLTSVLLLVVIHRCRAGVWFFQKASMPWEADFWRKTKMTTRGGANDNGATTQQGKEQNHDDETLMI